MHSVAEAPHAILDPGAAGDPVAETPSPQDRSEIIDLFAGPGGLDMAAHALGLTVTGVEWDGDACATRVANGLATRQGDVRNFGPADFPKAGILAGGPPCQTFTVAGNGAGRRALDQVIAYARRMALGEDVRAELDAQKDPRTGLVLEPLRWILEALEAGLPYQVIVLEQVPSVLPVWHEYRRILEKRGYSVKCDVLHTEEYGVPQTRRRAILIARLLTDSNALLHQQVEMPAPTHHRFHKGRPRPVSGHGLEPWVTMGEALGRKDAFQVVSNYGTGGDPKVRGQRTSDEPAFTVTGKVTRNRVVPAGQKPDPNTDGRFSDREAGRLQTFPAAYRWSGRAVAQQIGNAIPPRLGVHVLAAALELGSEDIQAALKRLENWHPPQQTEVEDNGNQGL
ncbi:DNA cytosine methyltransferase [Streptomyces sp. TLI_171]|uniref:DNA cytosine methyltransferase n=1 Tax=Streptomyces sp. TLI_171 TaxID=1938859 RepID=UPI000C18ABEF|nr:DNA cytosine methyltransferase [Streptomyces sp. TLI_171]RKE21916.1 DNA (cytosine-5)-methyltransferase 1 [Streptomyces sp. TLI_171]